MNLSSKTQNYLRILELVRDQEGLTRQRIAELMGVSMPTLLHAIEDLRNMGLVSEVGEQVSTGGRRAKVLSLNMACGYGIGIRVARTYIEVMVTDICGQELLSQVFKYPFRDDPAWYQALGEAVEQVIEDSGVAADKILGAGLSFPGIVDQEKNMLVHSHVFGLSNMDLSSFYNSIDWPLTILNDANSACLAEKSGGENTYLYISLNESVGGSLMVNENMYIGKHWQAGEVGHMILHPGGRRCYCGKTGCADAYLNTEVVTGGEMELSDFFRLVEEGDEKASDLLHTYIKDLAILISNLRMVLDMDIVLGGELGPFLAPYLRKICQETLTWDLFSRNVDYISICNCKDHMFSKGAALAAIKQNFSKLVS